jgi:hypothetical protein
MGSAFAVAIRLIVSSEDSDQLQFGLMTLMLATATIILSFYLQGWFVAFYYVPLFLFMDYGLGCLKSKQDLALSGRR